jgi:hypothetical protein
MSNVVILPVVTRLDIPAERILNSALEEDLNSAIVIGRTRDGDIYFSSSMPDGPEALWLLEKVKAALLAEAD